MTSRADLRRLAGSLATLGTELEEKGLTAWDRLWGWKAGPTKPAATGEKGGGGTETAAEDRRDEQRQARRAAEQFDEWRADLDALDRLVGKINRRLDMACPPTMEAIRNRRTGEFDPETAVDALAAGFCPNCWAAGVRQVPLCPTPEGKSTVARYGDRCRPCGDFRHAEGIDKPKELVVGHAQIPPRRFSPSETEAIIKAAKDRANPKKSKGKKRGRKAA